MEHADIRTLEADARDDVGRAAGVFPPGFPTEFGAFGGGLSSKDEGIDGE
jgi:hypothetical protein